MLTQWVMYLFNRHSGDDFNTVLCLFFGFSLCDANIVGIVLLQVSWFCLLTLWVVVYLFYECGGGDANTVGNLPQVFRL